MTTYFFIRHAEKEYDGTADPHLSEEGLKRADHWAEILGDKNIEGIYCTRAVRTQETVQPLLNKLDITPRLYDPVGLDYKRFQEITQGKTVLIVGHQDNIPRFVNRMLKENKYSYIKDQEFGNLYRVYIDKKGRITSSLKKTEF